MIVVVDHRECPSGLPDLLAKEFSIELTTLAWGDYCLNGRLTLERKTARDLCQSIIDGRLFRQVARLKKNCRQALLLVEGNPFRSGVAVDQRAIQGALLSVQAMWQLPVIYTGSRAESVEIMKT